MRLSAYLEFATEELLREDFSRLSQATDYDTCWAARLTNEDGTLTYPHLLQALADRQHQDGSWGSRAPCVHDRLLSTLAVVLLLRRFGHRRSDAEQITAGERYIWQYADGLENDTHATVGFEMILPALLAEAREFGLDLPYAQLRHYEEERNQKLSRLPADRIFQIKTTALFSLEAFGRGFDPDDVTDLILEDGSMAGSPSATACLLDLVPDWRSRLPRSAGYVEGLLENGAAGLPVMSPCGIFTRTWVLYYLHVGGLLSGGGELLKTHYDYLLEHWRPDGVGFSSHVLPDSDDTSMTLLALHRAGFEVDGSCLLAYERDEHFAVYDYEMDPSISANLHILEAIETLPEGDRERVRHKILHYVLGARRTGGYWGDKWHASTYYPTSQALIALLHHAPDQMDETLGWLLATQRPDGSWGQYTPTSEETALALLSLLLYYRAGHSIPEEPLRLAAGYLLAHENPFGEDHPELWTAKVLYAPTTVIRSIILAALALHRDTFEDKT